MRVLPQKGCHLKAISGKLSTKEGIDEEDVEDDVDKEEEFAEEHPDGPVVVGVEGAVEELGKGRRPVHPLILVQQSARFVQPGDDCSNLEKKLKS